ncbi:MAG: NAD-dependent deacetylase, partial [Candidatus Lokiarchaeota archaeon]|nr:NAD-dependent deacetylase [Candidatus Lokiarchaeota archaeon]
MDLEEKIDLVAKWIAESERLIVFTGAGISTASGLPDYRGPEGVWTRRDKG